MITDRIKKALAKAVSDADIDITKYYRVARSFTALNKPQILQKYKAIVKQYKMLDKRITVDGHDVPVRIFFPPNRSSNSVFLFFHGGGWVTGNIDTYTETCAELSAITGMVTLSVDYSLAPEHPFPEGLNDCYGVTRELYLNTSLLDIDVKDIVLIGDSAGGNIAAVVSNMARNRGEFKVTRQILLYPATYNDHSETSRFLSVHENGEGYLLTAKNIREYMSLYIREERYYNSPYFAPLLEETLKNNPKTLIITCELDPLRDEGEEYGARLRKDGNYVDIYRIENAMHGFISSPLSEREVGIAHGIILSFLKKTDDGK